MTHGDTWILLLVGELCEIMTGFNIQTGFFFLFFSKGGINPVGICSDPLMVILSTLRCSPAPSVFLHTFTGTPTHPAHTSSPFVCVFVFS